MNSFNKGAAAAVQNSDQLAKTRLAHVHKGLANSTGRQNTFADFCLCCAKEYCKKFEFMMGCSHYIYKTL